jgi:microcystin degradation protein MlrC
MKIFTAYFAHETNSFSPIPTNIASFDELGIYRPALGAPDAVDPGLLKGAGHFFHEARRRGDEVHVGLCAHAQPSHPLNRADFETMRSWLLEDLAAAGPVDAVLIMMHGSMMAEGHDDCEGDILRRIRDRVGPDVPIGVLLDLHCNITENMLAHATIIKACKEYPHTDFDQRARELYDICARIHDGRVRPATGFQRVPMLGLFQTSREPMRSFIDGILEREKAHGVLSITLAHGFPWSDFPEAGASVIVFTDGNRNLARSMAREIGEAFFALRETGQAPLVSVDAAIDAALGAGNGTAIIADMSDNAGGGAASDSTFILEALLNRGVKDAGVAYLWDPAAVDLCFAAGEGSHLPLRVGGKVGVSSGQPVDLEARILRLRDDARQPHIADGLPTALGRTALIEAAGIEVVLNDIRQQPFDPAGLVEAGMDVGSKRVLVLKSTHHFYAGFNHEDAQIIYCDAPGTLNSDVSQRPYARITRPIWPLDDIESIDVRTPMLAK